MSTVTETKGRAISELLSFLRGGISAEEFDLTYWITERQDSVARALILFIKQSQKPHRQNLLRTLLHFLVYTKGQYYRGIAWTLIQEIPLSWLLEIEKHITKPSKENRHPLRLAILRRIAMSTENEIFRAYLYSPAAFRRMFELYHFPNDKKYAADGVKRMGAYVFSKTFKIQGKESLIEKPIINQSYLYAVSLIEFSNVQDAMIKHNISPADLVDRSKFRPPLPLEKVFSYVKTPSQARELVKFARGDTFFQHARWFKQNLGTESFNTIVRKRIYQIKNPLGFTRIKDHLLETQTFSPEIMSLIDTQADDLVQQLLKDAKLERLAILVDLSPSMEVAQDITIKLYDGLTRFGKKAITNLIGFDQHAFRLEPEQLRNYKIARSWTSIGAAVTKLYQDLQLVTKDQWPEVILLVSDMKENMPPFINEAYRRYWRGDHPLAIPLLKEMNIPLVILSCGDRGDISIDYPHSVLEVNDFHDGLLLDILKQVVTTGVKATDIGEQRITKVVGQRQTIEEEIGQVDITPFQRSPASLKKGHLMRLLTTPIHKRPLTALIQKTI